MARGEDDDAARGPAVREIYGAPTGPEMWAHAPVVPRAHIARTPQKGRVKPTREELLAECGICAEDLAAGIVDLIRHAREKGGTRNRWVRDARRRPTSCCGWLWCPDHDAPTKKSQKK